jgi:hypothetical protein
MSTLVYIYSYFVFYKYERPKPVLIYGSEAWTIRKADEKRKTVGLTLWDHKRNEEI